MSNVERIETKGQGGSAVLWYVSGRSGWSWTAEELWKSLSDETKETIAEAYLREVETW